jgi:uncharacterized protein
MARPKNLRRIDSPPHFRGYTPVGLDNESGSVIINLEEYESLRLCDFELLSQEEAAVKMGVSRPTFTRVYSEARKKVAGAFVTGKGIIFEGGKIFFDSDWYKCINCGSFFNNYKHLKNLQCTLCNSVEIESVKTEEI